MNQSEAYGGAIKQSFAADIKISRHQAWSWGMTATAGSLAVQLPDARHLVAGYPVIQVVNEGATAFAIEDSDGTTLVASVTVDQVYTFGLVENDTAAGLWSWGQWDQHAAAAPTPTSFPWTLGGTDGGMIREAWRFDFQGDSWSQLGGSTVEAINDSNSARADTTGIAILANIATVVKTFDPNVWTDRTDASYSHVSGGGGREDDNNDRGYFYGANRSATGNVDEVEYYDVSGDSWTAVTAMLNNRHKSKIGSDRDTLHFVIGGAITVASFHFSVVDNDQYDIVGDSHTSKTSMNTARQDFGLAMAPFTGDVWCWCGVNRNGLTAFDDVESYSISGDSWTTRSDYAGGNSSQMAATRVDKNLRIYVIGATGGGDGDDVYKHNPQNDSYTAQTDHAGAANARGHVAETLTD